MTGGIISVKCKTPCRDCSETHMSDTKLVYADSNEEKVCLHSDATELEAIGLRRKMRG